MKRKNKDIYWDVRENELCFEWMNRKTRKDEFIIYNELSPKVIKMIEIILRRYFSGNYNESNKKVIINDLICHVFLNIKNFNIDMNKTWFSFIQTIIKNRCFDVLDIRKSKHQNDILNNKKHIISINDEHHNIPNSLSMSNLQENNSDVLNLEELKVNATLRLKKLLEKNILDVEREYLTLVMTFINNFDKFRNKDLSVYISNNSDLSLTDIRKIGRKYFNIITGAISNENEYESKKNKLYELKKNNSYIMLDYTPNRRDNSGKYNGLRDDDKNKYQYF